MHPVLNRNLFLVKEHAGLFKAANNFDIYDPETKDQILECREDRLGIFTKMLRFTRYKQMTPFDIEVRTPSGEPVLHVRRGISILLSKVDVLDGDESGTRIGGFKQKFLSIGGAFSVLDSGDNPICQLKGKWTGWDFRFMAGDQELARVSKKWSGISKEMFTSADNYILSISEHVPPDSQIRQLILAAVLCIDMVLKE
ncbi:MAG TPA: phospholipid scramblase-related protein [Lacipirellulaceae bacterium]|nr:phospholipid scramblase-related protein [Lacipirellulaceae bacterium]